MGVPVGLAGRSCPRSRDRPGVRRETRPMVRIAGALFRRPAPTCPAAGRHLFGSPGAGGPRAAIIIELRAALYQGADRRPAARRQARRPNGPPVSLCVSAAGLGAPPNGTGASLITGSGRRGRARSPGRPAAPLRDSGQK